MSHGLMATAPPSSCLARANIPACLPYLLSTNLSTSVKLLSLRILPTHVSKLITINLSFLFFSSLPANVSTFKIQNLLLGIVKALMFLLD